MKKRGGEGGWKGGAPHLFWVSTVGNTLVFINSCTKINLTNRKITPTAGHLYIIIIFLTQKSVVLDWGLGWGSDFDYEQAWAAT